MKYRLFFPILFVSLFLSSVSYGKTPLLPKELIEGANTLGYKQIQNYYEKRPGMVDPPYVYGCLPGDKQLSALFWAENNDTKRKYALILMIKRNFLEKGRFSIIYKTQNYPRGLSVFQGKKIDLSFFHYIEDLNRVYSGEILKSGILIYDIYDGIGSVFFFHDGKWLIAQYD